MKALIELLLPHAVLITAVAFLCRSIIAHFLNKDVEKFKDQLKTLSEAELVGLRHGHEVARLEHQVRFSRLYEKRFEKIEELHTDSRNLVDALMDALRVDSKTQLDRIVSAHGSIYSFQRKLRLHEIFLPKDFVTLWNAELTKMFDSLTELINQRDDPRFNPITSRQNAAGEIAESLRRLNGELADHARKIIENEN
jgi:hypothetical protein